MAAGQMAEFFATFGFKVNKSDIQKIDRTLNQLERKIDKVVNSRKLNDIKIQITGFKFTRGFNLQLRAELKRRLNNASNYKGLSPTITIDKFDVDKNALLRDMRQAVEYVESNIRVNLRTGVNRPTGVAGARGAAGGGGVSRFGAGMGVGSAAGNLGRGFIPGLGVAFGVSQLNQLNQQLIGQELASTAVFGNKEAGQEQLDWVRDLGNKIGFDYRSQANPYMKMAAAGKTAGMGTGQVQEIFTGMAEYGRVMGLNDEDMKGSMRAVEQMLNKGQVYAEELKMQLGEKFPAAIQLMAEAVSGGDTEKLFDMMEKGEVSSIEALPKFAKILSRQARVGGALTEAMKTSLAEQMRFNNTFNDLVMFLSDAGFEEGQAGIFRTMADFFKEMKPLLSAFGESWKYVADLLRVPLGLLVDLGRALEGLSSYTGMAKGQLLALGTVVAGILFPLTRMVTLVAMAFALLEDFTAFLSGRKSLLGRLLGDDAEGFRNSLLSAFETITSTVDRFVEVLGELWGLLSKEDFPLVDILQRMIESVETLFELLNSLLGGDSKAERERKREKKAVAEMGTNPVLAMGSRATTEEPGVKSSELFAQFIEKHPFMAVPRAWGLPDMIRNLGGDEENDAKIKQRMDEMRSNMQQYNMSSDENLRKQSNAEGSGGNQNNFQVSVTVGGAVGEEDINNAREAGRQFGEEAARRLDDRARGTIA